MHIPGIFSSWSIRKKLLLLLLVIFLPAAGIIVAYALDHRDHEIETARNDALLLVQSLAAEQEQIAIATKEMLSTLAQFTEMRRLDAKACNELFRDLQNRNPFYAVITAATPDGNVFASSALLPPGSVNLSDRKYVKDAIRTLDFSVGEYIVGRVSKVPSINYAYPVLDPDKHVVAVFIAGIKLDQLGRFVSKVNRPPGCSITITDRNGVCLYRSPEDSTTPEGHHIPSVAFERISGSPDQGIVEGTFDDTIRRINAFKQLHLPGDSSPYLYMIAGIPKDKLVREANLKLLGSLAILGFAGLVAVSLVCVFANLALIMPVSRMVAATERFGRGETGARTGLRYTDDEVGRLAKSFDDMASQLEMRSDERTRIENELEFKVAERTAALSRANEILQMEIGERKLAEEALRGSEEHFRTLVEHAPDGIFVELQGCFAYLNEAALRLYGASSSDDLLGRPIIHRVHPDSRSSVLERLRLVNEEKEPVPMMEQKYVRLDGSIVDVEVNAVPINYRKTDGGLVFLRDVTDRKEAHEALKESRRQLANIIDFLPDATFVIDKDGKVISWNKAIEEMTGVKSSDMLGKGNYEYALPFYGERRPILVDLALKPREQIERKYAHIERKGSLLVGEAYLPALKGGSVYLSMTACALRDSNGNIVGAIESLRDITERKLAELALARAEAKYRSIFENAIVGIAQSTPEGRLTSANPAFARILGYDSPEDILASVTDIRRQLFVDQKERIKLRRLLEKQGSVQGFEVQFFRKNGSVAWMAVNMRAVPDESGKIAYIEGTARDITERKLAEREKASLEARLRQAQRLEAIGTLAGGIAHDFNNVLGIIMGYSELAGLGLPEGSTEKKKIDEALRACQRAKDLIKQILSFSRPHEAQDRLPVDVRPIVKELLKFLRASLPSTIEIRQDISRGAGFISADPTQIHQVLTNLCTNAAHAMEEKGGILEVGLTDVVLDPAAVPEHSHIPPGRYMRITVSDTGHGMAPVTLERIFDPYFTTKEVGKGSGLGLAIVHGIVRGHEGAITVSSDVGKGTTFHVYLPIIELAGTTEEESDSTIPGGDERILLVDDEAPLVDIWREMLEQLGYEVATATSGTKGLELFEDHPDAFDLVITDYTMPRMTGLDLAGRITSIQPNVPIILCTGLEANVEGVKIKDVGVCEVLLKPINFQDSASAIRKALDNNHRRPGLESVRNC